MSWRDEAACRGRTDLDWFATQETPGAPSLSYKANRDACLAICAECAVRGDCLADALTEGEPYGIRGGYTSRQRQRMARPPVLQPIRHGTQAGYQAHRRRGEDPCAACKAGNATETAQRRVRARPEFAQ